MKNKEMTPSSIFAEWKRDRNYKNSMGFTSDWPKFTRFREGEQWPQSARDKWKNFTFITTNQCDFIINNKKSNILAQNIKLVFNPKEVPADMDEEVEEELLAKAKRYTDLATNTWNSEGVDQIQLNKDAVDDALEVGTGIYYYYYDSGYDQGMNEGRICGHTIDPMDVAFGNPQLKSHEIQKQPYIIFKTYEMVESVKEYAKENGKDYQLIVPDVDNDNEYDAEDLDQPDKVVCLTKLYKEKGAVKWVKVTKTSIVQENRSLSPDESVPFKLYPLETLTFKTRKNCSFGRSALADVISTQKGINFIYSMMAYSVQQTAWPKILAKAGALMQQITNSAGEVITDHDRNNPGDSVKFMQPPNFSNMPPILIDKLTDTMRQTTNTGDVISGEAIGANMAAAAIIALQNQAKKPTEMDMEQLFASQKRIGKIWEEFFKCYYILPRTVVSEDKNGKKSSEVFTPSDYKDILFEMTVDVGAGGAFDEALQVNTLDNLYQKGDVDKYQYVKYAPNNMVPQGMKQDFEDEQQQVEEQQIMQQQAIGQQQGANMDQILDQLTPEEQQAVIANPKLLEGL